MLSLSSKRKWLWVGIILLIITPPSSILVFGIALLIVEKKYRKVAIALIVLSVVLFAIYFAIAYFSLSGRATTPRLYSNTNSQTNATGTVLSVGTTTMGTTTTKIVLPAKKSTGTNATSSH